MGICNICFGGKIRKKKICVYSFVYHNICFVNMSDVIIHMGPDKIITGVIIFVLFKKKQKKTYCVGTHFNCHNEAIPLRIFH